MRDEINLGVGFEARADFKDLENIGWNFNRVYADAAARYRMPAEQVKQNFHVLLFSDGCRLGWHLCHNESGITPYPYYLDDKEKAAADIQHLYSNSKLWEVFEGEQL